MSERTELAKPNFTEAIVNFEKNNWRISLVPVSHTSFDLLGGQTKTLGQDYLYELIEKFGKEMPHRLADCQRLIGITTLAWNGVSDEISMALRTVAAVLAGQIESDFFHPLMELDDVAYFMDFIALCYLALASDAVAKSDTITAVEFLFEAAESNKVGSLFREDLSKKDFLSEMAVRSAKKRHNQDPKQAERRFIYECWCSWRQKPETYRSKAAFARDMLNKCAKLESQKVIEDWCRLWEKEIK